MNIVGIIPAHLASVRLERKVLLDLNGLPMIEHVRRRAMLSNLKDNVFVATGDKEIQETIMNYNGKVLITNKKHVNGTSRVNEAIQNSKYSHVILLQGDEPLLLPEHVNCIIKAIQSNPDGLAWNATGPLENKTELDKHSFVKCMVAKNNNIISCFRRSPCYSDFANQKLFIRKILGIIGYNCKFLKKLSKIPPSIIEKSEFIEQMRIIENGFEINSVPVNPSLPSVNEPHEIDIINNYLSKNPTQNNLLKMILSQ